MPECRNCGAKLRLGKDGKIPTHDYPPPCRSVCKGSGEHARRPGVPTWVESPAQEAEDFLDDARSELLVYGFAVVKGYAQITNQISGEMPCPLCRQTVRFSIATENDHCCVRCPTEGCITAME